MSLEGETLKDHAEGAMVGLCSVITDFLHGIHKIREMSSIGEGYGRAEMEKDVSAIKGEILRMKN